MPKPIPKRATLIAFEGIDGSGKTTAANLLIERLGAQGVGASLHLNRSLGPVRDALDTLAREDGYHDRFDMFGSTSAQFMGALLKWRELLDIEALLARENHVVVVDRYIYTHLALAVAHKTTNEILLRRMFGVFPTPDLVYFVDVDPEIAAERVFKRGRDVNSLDFLTRLRDGYMSLPEMRQFQVLNGGAAPATVVDDAWRLIEAKGLFPVEHG
ncbi:dTMP kinase [Streptomyces spongiae]|uniref:Thymidylate kinase n=1 Tax=Streptomyces spongiae TaxID=565072 RepID=A0A5N8X9M5_9ACTN|nr:AAA family ATPase [Streptomyces spongiae]MPY55834.1 AAA family ATPase [Streptomyces spongiae]